MAKKEINNFPGPSATDHVIVQFMGGPGPEGKVVGIFDDAFVVERAPGEYVVCYIQAIESIWIKEGIGAGEQKEGV